MEMMKQGKISNGQAALFAFASAAGNICYTFTFVTLVTGRAFWVAVMIGVLMNIPLAVWTLYLGSFRQEGTIFDLLESGLGKIVCKIFLLVYLGLNIAIAACMVNMFNGTLKEYFLPNTPGTVIMFFLILICTVFVSSGISIFGRLVQILGAFFIANYYLGFFLSFIKEFDIKLIVPIFDTTPLHFLEGVMISTGSVAECILFFMVMVKSMPQSPKYYKSVIKGIAVWSVLLALAIIIMEGDVGSELLSRIALAGISVSSIIQIGNFISGLEVLILVTYEFIAINKIIICVYSCQECLNKMFNAKKGTLTLIISGLLVFVASAYLNSLNAGYYYAVVLGSYVILPFVLLVLILASVSFVLVKKKSGNT